MGDDHRPGRIATVDAPVRDAQRQIGFTKLTSVASSRQGPSDSPRMINPTQNTASLCDTCLTTAGVVESRGRDLRRFKPTDGTLGMPAFCSVTEIATARL